MRILLVEDDKIIGDGVVRGLELEGFAVDWVGTEATALSALRTNHYELLILDLGLPDGSGFNVLKQLRNEQDDLPVLILTAYDQTNYKVQGLDGGADDYLVKPFDLEELYARIRALRRRANGTGTPNLTTGHIVLNPATREVTLNGGPVNLGPKEFLILQTLMEKPGLTLSKSQIEDSLYGWNVEIESNTIEVHVHGIRKKLGKDCIQTIRNVGYRVETKAT